MFALCRFTWKNKQTSSDEATVTHNGHCTDATSAARLALFLPDVDEDVDDSKIEAA
jgi:hypothetical protein